MRVIRSIDPVTGRPIACRIRSTAEAASDRDLEAKAARARGFRCYEAFAATRSK